MFQLARCSSSGVLVQYFLVYTKLHDFIKGASKYFTKEFSFKMLNKGKDLINSHASRITAKSYMGIGLIETFFHIEKNAAHLDDSFLDFIMELFQYSETLTSLGWRTSVLSLLMVLIEDIIAVQNLDEILEVDEIDVFFVAPNDLAATMGYIGKSDHKDVQETIENTLKRIVSSGRTAGTLTTVSALDKFLDIGVNCICVNIGPFLNEGVISAAKKVYSK